MTLPARTLSLVGDLLTSAPIDVNAVATRLGLTIYEKPLDRGISGMIIREADKAAPSGYVIYVDQNEAYVRQRFTAAHEIGHFVLHQEHIGDGVTDNHLFRSDRLSNWMEVQANRFAADLLMPYDLIDELVRQGVDSVPELAKALGVSEIAMGIRLGHPT